MMRSILHFELLLFVAKCGGAVWVHRVKVSHDPVTPSGSKSIFFIDAWPLKSRATMIEMNGNANRYSPDFSV